MALKRGKHILVLGNSPQINEIDFDRLDPSVITLGVNRIWLKHKPDYLFFHDYDIVQELEAHPELLAQLQDTSEIYSSDWLRASKKTIPNWVKVYARQINTRRMFPDSVTTAMLLFSTHYEKINDCTFYIAGVPLKWCSPSHFWKQLDYHNALNKNQRNWYDPRFQRVIHNFKRLRNIGFRMVSATPHSELNRFLRFENIENLYIKGKP